MIIFRKATAAIGYLKFAALILVSVGFSKAYAIEMRNFDSMSNKMGFQTFYKLQTKLGRPVRVAIFDNGFDGYEKLLGQSLPADTTYRLGSATDAPVDSSHGIAMAELLTAFMTNNNKRADLNPQLFLFQVTGYTNFKNAIDEAIRLKVDIVLHSMVREYGSNYDGHGFFNAEVNRALDAGIVWFNAAGNFAKTTYNMTGMPTNSDAWVTLPGPNQSVPIHCTPVKNTTTCPARIVLSWNDFKDDPNVGTDKDLDLYLTDDTLNIVQASSLIQTSDPKNTSPGTSLYPREIIEVDLKPGKYFLRVKNRSQNFAKTDRLRLTADSDSITFDYNDSQETLLNPADNSRVITVGALDSDRSSKSQKLNKPELASLSYVQTGVSEGYLGSSNSAAIAAAAAALMLEDSKTVWSRDAIIKNLKSNFFGNKMGVGPSLTLAQLGFRPSDGSACFVATTLTGTMPAYITAVLEQGGVFVKTTSGLRILVNFDPISITGGLTRFRPDDIISTTPQGYIVSPRSALQGIPNTWAEVFETPSDAGLCN